MLNRLSTSVFKNIRQTNIYSSFDKNDLKRNCLLKTQYSDETTEVEYQEEIQEDYSDDDNNNNNNNNNDGPQGGRMIPVIELIKGFIPRIITQI